MLGIWHVVSAVGTILAPVGKNNEREPIEDFGRVCVSQQRTDTVIYSLDIRLNRWYNKPIKKY